MHTVSINISKVSFHTAYLNQNGSVIFLMVTNAALKLIRVIFAMVNNNLLFFLGDSTMYILSYSSFSIVDPIL